MSKELKYNIDNRDSNTTHLVLENGDYIVVNVFELVENSIENNVDEDQQSYFINLLYTISDEI